MKITIEIDNINIGDYEALNDFFRTWQYLGNIGSSRWTSFFVGGGYNFQPKITINNKPTRYSPYISKLETWHKPVNGQEKEYRIDPDYLAWRINNPEYEKKLRNIKIKQLLKCQKKNTMP